MITGIKWGKQNTRVQPWRKQEEEGKVRCTVGLDAVGSVMSCHGHKADEGSAASEHIEKKRGGNPVLNKYIAECIMHNARCKRPNKGAT
jgi:hypothetical protein